MYPNIDWSIYSVHFRAIKSLKAPVSEYSLSHKWIYKQRFCCIWWCKDGFCSNGSDAASALLYDKNLLKAWFGVDYGIFLLRKANVGIAVTDLTMVLFLFFFKKSMVFVNSPATSTQFRHWERKAPLTHLVQVPIELAMLTEGSVFYPYWLPHWQSKVGTLLFLHPNNQ